MKERKKWMKQNSAKCLVTTLLVALALFSLAADSLEKARAVDLTREGEITVNLVKNEDVDLANVVVDLYKVADASANEGEERLQLMATSAFTSLQNALDDLENANNDDLLEVADQAARITFAEGSKVAPSVRGGKAGEKLSGLSCGVYLVIAHGEEVEDYVSYVRDADGKERLATLAESETKLYRFKPQLFVLPMHDIENHSWAFDLTMDLKSESEDRFGDLEIQKKLLTYVTDSAAEFVFQIEAYKDETKEKSVYSNVVKMSFTEPGQQSLVLEGKIPVGSYVEVTEVYSGTKYVLISEPTQQTTIQRDEIATVTFVNDYDETDKGGGAVTNRFEYSEETGWNWVQE